MITRRLASPLGALSSRSWVCPACARASPVQSRLSQGQRRAKHNVPPLRGFDTTFEERGVPNLFTAAGFRMGWTEYQEMIVDKLNQLTAGEETHNQKPHDLLMRFARDPMNASLFNHASMAYNNHFFFQGLSTAPMHIDDNKIGELKKSLEQTFGSIDTLRTTMLDTAAAMFGPGFVWLVWARDPGTSGLSRRGGDWRVLTTYNAGTPFPAAGYRRQGLDMNTNNAATFADYQNAEPANNAGSFGRHSAAGREDAPIPPGGTQVAPVLCVNTWEHVWLYDFGVKGKRRYLADWWEAIDWDVVQANTPPHVLMPQGRFLRS